jgi:hypothetical protein
MVESSPLSLEKMLNIKKRLPRTPAKKMKSVKITNSYIALNKLFKET